MKIHKSALCLILVLVQVNLFGQKARLQPIKWSEEKLSWEDYKANPERENPKYAATTSSGLSYSWSYSTKNDVPNLSFEVYANFYPKNSWVKPGKKNASLLAHEQLHFDISELHARKLLNFLEEYVPGRNIRADLRRMYTKIESERKRMQARYDKATNHGLDEAAQEKWGEKIKKALRTQ